MVFLIDTGAPENSVEPHEIGAATNRNLLDNWYFRDPVNQRGQTEYSGQGYMLDRWESGTAYGRCKLTENGLHVYSESASYSQIRQKLENPEQYFGKTLTFSALRSDNKMHTFTVTVPDAFQSTSTTLGSNGIYSMRIATTSLFVMFSINTDPDYDIVAVKLELGSTQTLAHQDADGTWVLNDPPPNKALELAKCQRYYERCGYNGERTQHMGYCFADGKIDVPVEFLVEKRIQCGTVLTSVSEMGIGVDAPAIYIDGSQVTLTGATISVINRLGTRGVIFRFANVTGTEAGKSYEVTMAWEADANL